MFMDHTRSAAFQINLKNAKSPSKISSVSTYSENRDIITAYHRLGKDLWISILHPLSTNTVPNTY